MGQTQAIGHAFLGGTAFAACGTLWERPEYQEGGGKLVYTRVLRETRGPRRPCACGCRLVEIKIFPSPVEDVLQLYERQKARPTGAKLSLSRSLSAKGRNNSHCAWRESRPT